MSDQPSDDEQATAPRRSPASEAPNDRSPEVPDDPGQAPDDPTAEQPAEAAAPDAPTAANSAKPADQPAAAAEKSESAEAPDQPAVVLEKPATATSEPAAEAAGATDAPSAATRPAPELPKRSQSPFGRPTTANGDDAKPGGAAARLPGGITPGMLVAAIGALVTFLAAFLTWATADFTSRVANLPPGGVIDSASGLTGNRLGKATLVLAIAVLILLALMRLPATSAKAWIVVAAGGGLIVLIAVLDLFAIINDSDLPDRLASVQGCGAVVQCTAERSAGVGVYLTIVGGLVVVVGALLHGGVFDRLQARIRADRQQRAA